MFYEDQGIAHNEFNRLSFYQHPDGRIFFGGLNGITTFQPADFHEQEAYEVPLRVATASLFSFEEDSLQNILPDLRENGALKLCPQDNFLNLEFSLQDYSYSNRVRYSYRIPGVRDQWSPLEGNALQLAGLPYGTHTLAVRARGRKNKLSAATLQLELVVLRPFYLRWWFIALALVTAAISVWQYTNWRKRSLIRRQQILKRIVAQRTEQIRQDKQLIEEQAAQLGMSTRRVQQKLKTITGMSPKKYQREIQLESARRLLESGEVQSVAEVSRQMGFTDAHYFSKLFEKRFGKHPSTYL